MIVFFCKKYVWCIAALYLISVPVYVSAATIGKPANYMSITSGLVGHWTFDAKDMGPNVRDMSGNGNHGNLSGQAATTTTGGRVGQALLLDGVNDSVIVPPASSINDLPMLTVSFWARPSTMGINRPYLAKADNAHDGHGWWVGHHTLNSSILRFAVPGFSGDDLRVDSTAGAFVLNEWAHYTVTWDGTNQASGVRFYKNGVELSYTTKINGGAASPQTDAARSLRMGQDPGYGSNYVAGSLDDVRLYNRVLAANEIRQLYTMGASRIALTPRAFQGEGLNRGLIGHWTFDGKDMAPNVRDVSGNGNHGNLSGQTATTTIAGKIGQALVFDGVNDAVRIPDSNSLDIDDSEGLTQAVWVYSKSFVNWPSIIEKRNNYDLRIQTNGVVDSSKYFNNNTRCRRSVTTGALKLNQWYHVVSVAGTTTCPSVYINGVLQGMTGSPGAATYQATYPLAIGNRSSENDQMVHGYLDDVRLYNRELSIEEIRQLYTMGASRIALTPRVPQGEELHNGLVGYWTFDGPDVNWGTGRVNDMSGQGNSAQMVGLSTTTSPVPGKFGQALYFDGDNGYVNAGSAAVLDNLSAVSVSVWARANGYGETNQGTFVEKNNNASGGWIFQAISSGKKVRFVVSHSGSSLIVSTADNTLTERDFGQWIHWAATWDGGSASTSVRIYKNGVETSYATNNSDGVGTRLDDSVRTVTIGNYPNAARTFYGSLDEVRLYNRVLSADEVRSLYNKGR